MLIPLGSSSQEVSPFPAAPFARVGTDPETCAPARTLSLSVRPENLHWLSAGTTSFARGLNDAPKIAALTMPLLLSGEGWRALSFCVVAIGMGVGSIVGGSRIARVLGERISRIEGQGGLGANLATSILVLGASPLGLPVSTTHVATGAITGTGLSAGTGAVSWEVLKGIVLAWIVTLPVSALLGAGAMMLLGTAR
jgi:PiT family inorganic phosphate transporter